MSSVMIFIILPLFRLVEAKNLFHQTTRLSQTRHNHRVQTQTKKGTQKKREYSLCKKKTPRFRNLPRPFASSRGESR